MTPIFNLVEKIKEQNILKVIKWSQENKIQVENLTKQQIMIATKTYLKS